MSDLRIADTRVTPIAFDEPPRLNNAGCHQPHALRSIIEIETEDGVIGLGESYGNQPIPGGLSFLETEMTGRLDLRAAAFLIQSGP